ncbi:hypothetical protein Golomagni_06009, partial [Golovinomyces magnicellulatus]
MHLGSALTTLRFPAYSDLWLIEGAVDEQIRTSHALLDHHRCCRHHHHECSWLLEFRGKDTQQCAKQLSGRRCDGQHCTRPVRPQHAHHTSARVFRVSRGVGDLLLRRRVRPQPTPHLHLELGGYRHDHLAAHVRLGHRAGAHGRTQCDGLGVHLSESLLSQADQRDGQARSDGRPAYADEFVVARPPQHRPRRGRGTDGPVEFGWGSTAHPIGRVRCRAPSRPLGRSDRQSGLYR